MKKTKNRIIVIATVLLFVVGFGILAYPTISSKWNAYRDSLLIVEYENKIAGIDYTEYFEAARAYNQGLVGGLVPDVFAIREDVSDPEYEALLNVDGSSIMGYVHIPCIDIKLPIYHYASAEVLMAGAGHLPGSSLPVGGESCHSVITAHRGLPNAKMFTDLNLVREGDTFYVIVLGETFAYEVDFITTVYPYETSALAIEEGYDYVTLITCTPYAVNTHRLFVRGHRVEFDQEVFDQAEDKGKTVALRSFDWVQMVCIGLGILIPVLIASLIGGKKRKKRRKKRKAAKAKKKAEKKALRKAKKDAKKQGKKEE